MTRFWLTVGVVVVASVAMLVYGLNKYARFDMADASDGEIADRYRVVCGTYRDLDLDIARIPPELQDLVPLAARYEHDNRVLLEDCAVKMSAADRDLIVTRISEKQAQIEAWIAKYPRDFNADEVQSFRRLLELKLLLRPAIVEPGKTVL